MVFGIEPGDWDSDDGRTKAGFLHDLERQEYDTLEDCAEALCGWLHNKYDLIYLDEPEHPYGVRGRPEGHDDKH